jgi:ATP-dependent DNA helicase RecG
LFSKTQGQTAKKRLELMTKTTDGFVLAEKDLEMRGAGDMWGTVQSGFSDIEFLREISLDIWEYAKDSAEKIVGDSALLEKYPLLKKQLERFEIELHRE